MKSKGSLRKATNREERKATRLRRNLRLLTWRNGVNLGKIYPFVVFLAKGSGNLPKDSKVKADQIRMIDKTRFLSQIGKLRADEVAEIEKAIMIHLGLP
jgi:mRNA interferase MazF